jgi:hypothetical protein
VCANSGRCGLVHQKGPYRPAVSTPNSSDYTPQTEMYCQPGPRAWLLALVCTGSASGLRVAFSTSRPRTVRSCLAPPVMCTNETGVGTSPGGGEGGDFGPSALQRCALLT